jgi:GTPase SAR1 family protein
MSVSMWEHLKFKHTFTCIVAGPTGSGKSTFCFKLLHNLNTLCTETEFKGGIIWCYSDATAVPREQLPKLGRSIKYQEGLPKEYGNPRGEASLIILDDL